MLSLVLLYLAYPFLFAHYVDGIAETALDFGYPTWATLHGFPLPVAIIGYGIHVVVAIAVGAAIGEFTDKVLNRDKDADRREAWDYTFEEVYDGNELIVVTTDDVKIQGTKVEKAHSSQEHDLLLVSPKAVELTDEGEYTASRRMGDSLYIHERNLARVLFLDDEMEDDPDSKREKSESDMGSLISDLEEQSREQELREEQARNLDDLATYLWGIELDDSEKDDDP